ncbi:HesA/MoeB/ThiF family protein [Sporobolomyces salmoneus]|uniref:HesA/MoeB/ThiF family protein n=1 Tax=Sporobolomyces salmoneus TaxID=183962 RepID=UPI00316DBB1E
MSDPALPSRTRHDILSEITSAKARLAQLEAELASFSSNSTSSKNSETASTSTPNGTETIRGSQKEWPLSLREYKRYGRQMLINPIGLPGQLKLKRAHILVVGAGGLGCPVLLYLAAAGVGEITILDHDTVELSNLHRQVLHTEERVGMSKAQSAKIALEALNSDIEINAYEIPFIPSIFHSPSTPSSLITPGTFSLVLDCTDNPATRHFLSSYAVAMDVPLVSGGAVRAEGTVGVYGLPIKSTTSTSDGQAAEQEERGPCYACIFPPPPPTPVSTSSQPQTQLERDLEAQRKSLAGTGACSDEGVLGINCGIVGIGMAAEAVKVLLGIAKPTLHLFAPLSPSPYRTIKTRARKPTCSACGTLSLSTLEEGPLSTPQSRWKDFIDSKDGQWPGWEDPLCSLPGVGEVMEEGRVDERVRVKDLKELQERKGVRIVDTRPEPEFGIVNLKGSVNVPFAKFLKDPSVALDDDASLKEGESDTSTIAFICRRGNDSLLASRALRRWISEKNDRDGRTNEEGVRIVDIVGGLTAYAKEVEGFPVY